VVHALAAVARHPGTAGATLHVGGVATTWRALIAAICAALEVPPPPPGLPVPVEAALTWCLTQRVAAHRPTTMDRQLAKLAARTLLFSDERLVRLLGYAPAYDLLEAVEETVAWYRGMAHGRAHWPDQRRDHRAADWPLAIGPHRSGATPVGPDRNWRARR
jgi:nucleoside-diphosphate-sugar epimerase